MLFRFWFKLLNDCVLDGVIDVIVVDVIVVNIGLMDMKLEMATAEEVLPPMIGCLGCGVAGCCRVSLTMTAVASGPNASTHDDDDINDAVVGAAVVT